MRFVCVCVCIYIHMYIERSHKNESTFEKLEFPKLQVDVILVITRVHAALRRDVNLLFGKN